MKTLAKLVMLLAVLSTCMPAQGEILIYAKTLKCFEATEIAPDYWDVYDGSRKGFLILDVEYDQGKIVGINQAVQVEFGKDYDGKWFFQNYHEFGSERIVYNGVVYLVLEEFYTNEELLIFTFRGKTKDMNIGLGRDEKREVPRRLEGFIIENYDVDFLYKRICSASLRFLNRWTQQANNPDIGNQDFEYAEYDIVKEWLISRRYMEAEDAGQDHGDIDDGGQDDGDQDDGDQDDDDDDNQSGIIWFP